jgi:heme-degrading monooxygenase HmoA
MVYLIVQINVGNYDKWKSVYDERSAIRKENGSKEARVFRDSEDHNEVVILYDWDKIENAKKFFESEDVQKALQKSGGKIMDISYLDEVEKTI